MAQQYNQFGHNTNQNPNTTYSQIPGLFPTSLPFQPNFQQSWPNNPSWQANGQYDYSGGNFMPNLAPANGYFPGQQADYISLDNGEEFYGDQDHSMSGVDNFLSQNPDTTQKPPISSDSSKMLNTLRAKLMRQKAAAEKAKTPEANTKAINGSDVIDKSVENGSNANAPKAQAVNEKRLMQLVPREPANGTGADKQISAQASAQSLPAMPTNSAKAMPAAEAPQPPVSSFDIEALFSSVRATEAAKKDEQTGFKAPLETKPVVKIGKEKLANEKADIKKGVKTNHLNKPQPLQVKEDTHQSAQDSTTSSEQLEQGEIREESSKSTPPSTKPSTPKGPSGKASSGKPPGAVADEKVPSRTLATQSKSTQPTTSQTVLKQVERQLPKLDTTLTDESRGKSNTNSQKLESPLATRTPGPKPKDIRDNPVGIVSRNDRRDERGEQCERRGDFQDDRRDDRRADYRDAYGGSSRQLYDRSRPYDREYDRERPIQYDSFRPAARSRTDEVPAARSRVEEAAAEASEYRKGIAAQTQKAEPRPEAKPVAKEAARPDSKAGRVLEVHTAFPAPRSPELEKRPSTAKDGVTEDASDVQDWLEMTGYFDKPYREKALARHRKLVELDRQRAELEMETKVELEERLHLARFSSLLPRASIESRSFTPQIFSNSQMLPPPVPAREVQSNVDEPSKNPAPLDPVPEPKEDVGIQIKDLARRITMAVTTRPEDAPRGARPVQEPTVLTPGLKRPLSGDYATSTPKPVEKLARTDSQSHSFDKKSQPSPSSAKPPASASLESRISVDYGTHARREYQARSRSPEPPRRRSPSPPPHYRNAAAPSLDSRMARRLSDDDGYSPLRRPDLSRDVSPHMRGPPYDGGYDGGGGSYGRYERYRADYDTRSNPSYDSYTNERRGGYASYRGRGRARARAGHAHAQSRGAYSKTFERRGSE